MPPRTNATQWIYWRGQDQHRYAWDTNGITAPLASPFGGNQWRSGPRTISITWNGTASAQISEDLDVPVTGYAAGVLRSAAGISAPSLPLRINQYTYTTGPASSLEIGVDRVTVTSP